jgi:hypothetical protein
MRNQVFKAVGKQVAYGVARKQLDRGGAFDLKLGMALLKDARVPAGSKMLALGIGVAAVAVFDTLEIPLEALIAFLLPVLGVGINFAVDGLQYVTGSLLLAAVLLPRLAPPQIVERIRNERDRVLVPATAPSAR